MDILELIEKRKMLQEAGVGASSKAVEQPAAPKNDYHERKEREKERRRIENQVKRLEEKLAGLEKEEKAMQATLGANGGDAAALEKRYAQLGEIAARIASTMEEWERASGRLQELPGQDG
jgi:chromosome segregation ATPase